MLVVTVPDTGPLVYVFIANKFAPTIPAYHYRTNSSGEFILGAGVAYALNKPWALRAGWNRYPIEDENINLLGISLVYRVPRFGDKTY